MSFTEFLARQPLERYERALTGATAADVERALASRDPRLPEFLALLSPAAAAYLELLAQRAQEVTRERFGRVVQLYAPLYLSNECTNGCVYCGFNRGNAIRRSTLDSGEIRAEADALWAEGFRSLLLVSGEAPRAAGPGYLEEAVRELHRRFAGLGVEVYPLDTPGYERLVRAGVDALTIYQETYDPALYAEVHPSGPKADYRWRLDAPARGARAGMRRVGIGALLGLGPWRSEAVSLALHALWLQKQFWQTQVCVSFPRLRAAPGGYRPRYPLGDRDLVQLACALRLLLPDAGLVLSTREAAHLRDGLAPICITHMSAGSRTEPGGYTRPGASGGQFAVEDHRSPAQVAARLLEGGIEPVWKDWDAAFAA